MAAVLGRGMTGFADGGGFTGTLAAVRHPEQNPMRRILAASLLSFSLALAVSPVQAQEFSSLEERMSARDFREAGLEKLSPEELARLNAWLAANGLAAPAAVATATPLGTAPPAEDRRGFRERLDTREISARVAGTFTGWAGVTEITLDNGQVWRVTDPNSRLRTGAVESPRVTLRAGALGSWWMIVEGFNTRAPVERIR
jgi:hypothetical protein